MAKEHAYSTQATPYEQYYMYDLSTVIDPVTGEPDEALLITNYNQVVTPRYEIVNVTNGQGNMNVTFYYGGSTDLAGKTLRCIGTVLTFPIRYNDTTIQTIDPFPDTNEFLTFVLHNTSFTWATNTT